MEFGILFTSHPNTEAEPYPHRDVHRRVTQQILRADQLGFDYAWIAEHHFSNEYGIMPDVFVYAGYLAALTKRIKIGTAVVTLPLANPLRVAENTAFVDILSNGRFALGLGSGYRKYEFDGFGADFDGRRDVQEEALPLVLELLQRKRIDHRGKQFNFKVDGSYEIFPHALQEPHPPIFLAGATERSIGTAARMGLGLFLSSWTPFDELARQSAHYRALLAETPRACAPIRRAVTSTWRAGFMSPRPMPRPRAKAKPASCAISPISAAATPRAISAPSAPAPATTGRSPAT
jgi:alkanesulfonate monooxygenase SsuD/methylene tetrahydromethanopterin reductase-like flavin-dependent oxidoreductase (luciferase family)